MTLNRYVQFRIVNEPCGHLVKLCNDLVRESELVKCEERVGQLHHTALDLNRNLLDIQVSDFHLGRLGLRLRNQLRLFRFRLRNKDRKSRDNRFLPADAEREFQNDSSTESGEFLRIIGGRRFPLDVIFTRNFFRQFPVMRAVRFKDGAVIKNCVHRTRIIIRTVLSWRHLGTELLVSAAEEHKRIRADLRRNVIDSRIHINACVKCHRALAQFPSEPEFQ